MPQSGQLKTPIPAITVGFAVFIFRATSLRRPGLPGDVRTSTAWPHPKTQDSLNADCNDYQPGKAPTLNVTLASLSTLKETAYRYAYC